jgi:hypothetical protein
LSGYQQRCGKAIGLEFLSLCRVGRRSVPVVDSKVFAEVLLGALMEQIVPQLVNNREALPIFVLGGIHGEYFACTASAGVSESKESDTAATQYGNSSTGIHNYVSLLNRKPRGRAEIGRGTKKKCQHEISESPLAQRLT